MGVKKKRKRRRKSGLLLLLLAAGLLTAAGEGVHVAAGAGGGHYSSLGRQLASSYGWGSGPQWYCLDVLWIRESGWRMVWNTQGSGAFGIPQALPASKMAAAGADYMTNPGTQIRWGLGYIHSTYGTPCKAWGHEQAHGWY